MCISACVRAWCIYHALLRAFLNGVLMMNEVEGGGVVGQSGLAPIAFLASIQNLTYVGVVV